MSCSTHNNHVAQPFRQADQISATGYRAPNRRITPARARQLFFAGLLVFLAAKLYLVLPPTAALAAPRLGDDAMAYLWHGKRATLNDPDHLPALKDILGQRFLSDQPPEELGWMRSDVVHRTLGTLTPSYDYLAAGALAVAPDLRWAFAFTEIIGVIAMAAGMGWFLFEVCGAATAGLAMMIMAFAVLPGQGIYAFIPGTLALSCGLLLWAYLWRCGRNSNARLALVAALLILGLHPIAKIYVVAAPAILWLRLGRLADWRSLALWRIGIACIAALGVSILLPMLVPAFHPPPSAIMGEISLHKGVSYNLAAVLPLLTDPLLRKNLLWALLLASALMLAPRVSFSRPLVLLLAGTAAIMAVSLTYYQPLNAGQLFIRVGVLFVLFGAAVGARFVLHLLDSVPLRRYMAIGITTGGLLLSAALWVIDFVPHTMNWRNEVLEEELIRTQLTSFSSDTTLLYADTYLALQISLLLDGYRLGALAYPMLAGTPSLDRLVSERKPAAIVTPGFTSLNSLAAQRAKNFVHRRQGLYFPSVDRFALSRGAGSSLGGLQILTDSPDAGASLRWQPLDATGHSLGPAQVTPLPVGKSWIALPVPVAAGAVQFFLPDSRAWVLGIGSGAPAPHVLWPWKAGWSLNYGFRGKDDSKSVSINFTPRALLEQVHAEELVPYVDSADPVLADDGGLVFLRTIIQPR